MRKIAESNVLFRAQAALPEGFKVSTEEFRDGWLVMRSVRSSQLEKKMRAKDWNLVRLEKNAKGSGVAKNAEDAVASALKQALKAVEGSSNAVEVERVEVTAYPWFFLARLTVNPLSMQQHAGLPLCDQLSPDAVVARSRKVTKEKALSVPFKGGMPALKALLTVNTSASLATR